MSAVAKTLWLIESRFRETLSLDDMAAHAGMSRSHLSRIFPIVTGYSLSAYIRGRRLTEAAKVLADGAPDILGVALDAGYGSHEAFSRAFREQFALTPDELRRRRSLDALPLVEPIRMDPSEKTKLAPPKIENLPPMRLAGLNQHYTAATLSGIPDQWQRFQPFIQAMADGAPGDAFAVVGRIVDDHDGFDYFSAIPLAPGAEVLPGLTQMTLPAARYARVRHLGHISQLRATCAAIFEDWLPTSGYDADHKWFSFLEYYGPDFNPQTGLGTVEIWLALKR
jgi:AraC family transcriptional regulator